MQNLSPGQLCLILMCADWKRHDLHGSTRTGWGPNEGHVYSQQAHNALGWVYVVHALDPVGSGISTEYVVMWLEGTRKRHCDTLLEACQYLLGNDLQPEDTDVWL